MQAKPGADIGPDQAKTSNTIQALLAELTDAELEDVATRLAEVTASETAERERIRAEIAKELGVTDRGRERPSYREMLGSPPEKNPAAVY